MHILTVCKCFNVVHICESLTALCLHALCDSLSSHVGFSVSATLCICHCYDNNIAPLLSNRFPDSTQAVKQSQILYSAPTYLPPPIPYLLLTTGFSPPANYINDSSTEMFQLECMFVLCWNSIPNSTGAPAW